jgi:hypothetical protein
VWFVRPRKTATTDPSSLSQNEAGSAAYFVRNGARPSRTVWRTYGAE